MTNTDETLYRILIILTPILLSILSVVGGLAVRWLIKINTSLQDLNVTVEKTKVMHDNLEKRVDKLERKIHI